MNKVAKLSKLAGPAAGNLPVLIDSLNPKANARALGYSALASLVGILPGSAISSEEHSTERVAGVEDASSANRVITNLPTGGEGLSFTVESHESLEPHELNEHVSLKYQRGYETDAEDATSAYEQMSQFVDTHSEVFENPTLIESISLHGVASAEDGDKGEPAMAGLDTASPNNEELAAQRLGIGKEAFLEVITKRFGQATAKAIAEKLSTSSAEQVLTEEETNDLQNMADSLGVTVNEMVDQHDRDPSHPMSEKSAELLNRILTSRRGVDVAIKYLEPKVEQVVVPSVAVGGGDEPSISINGEQTIGDSGRATEASATHNLLPTEKGFVGESESPEDTEEEPRPDPVPTKPAPRKFVDRSSVATAVETAEAVQPRSRITYKPRFADIKQIGRGRAGFHQVARNQKQPLRGNMDKNRTYSQSQNRRGRGRS